MQQFNVPSKDQVSTGNQVIFDNLQKALGFVPNLYATLAYSDTALESYLQFQNAKTGLSKKEKELVNLVVSQHNECLYCLSANTVLGKMNGFTEVQIMEIRGGTAGFDPKLDALARFAREVVSQKGRASQESVDQFLNAGYNRGHVVDVILNVAEKIVLNYLHNLTEIPIDFPIAPELAVATH